MLMAAETPRDTRRLRGVIDGLIVDKVAGQGLTVEAVTILMCGRDEKGRCREADARVIGARLREALNVLAWHWYGPDRRAMQRGFMPDWGRPGMLTSWGTVDRGNVHVHP